MLRRRARRAVRYAEQARRASVGLFWSIPPFQSVTLVSIRRQIGP